MLGTSFWALLAAASFSCMAATVKYCADDFSALELVFYRSAITTVVVLMLAYASHCSLKTTQIKGHLIRDFLGLFSVCIWFYTLGKLPLGTNVTLTYTTALFLGLNFIVLSLMRHMKPPVGAVLAIVIGFSGIVVVMRPTFSDGQAFAASLCLLVGCTDLLNYWQVRRLGATGEPSLRIVFYFSLFCVLATFAGVVGLEDGFHAMTLKGFALIALMGTFATVGMIASTRAWVGGNMLLVGCLGFSAIPFAEAIGIVLFGKNPDTYTWIGMLLIVVAGVLSTIYTKKEGDNILKIEKGASKS